MALRAFVARSARILRAFLSWSSVIGLEGEYRLPRFVEQSIESYAVGKGCLLVYVHPVLYSHRIAEVSEG